MTYDRNKNSNKQRQRFKNRDTYKFESKNDVYKKKEKAKTFLNNEKITEQITSDIKDYHQSENLKYFNSDDKLHEFDSENIYVNISVILDISCRTCKFSFSFNNALHRHIRQDCIRKIMNIQANIDHRDFNSACLASHFSDCFVINTLKTLSILRSAIDSNQDIDIEYDFNNWQYVITELCLAENASSIFECVDSEAEIILTNIIFFKFQTKDRISIRTMTTSIIVLDLRTNKHLTDKYAIILIYFKEKNQQKNEVRAMTIKKIHLINDLKINILLENNIFDFELFDIFMSTNTTYIESCKITISINITTTHRFFQSKFVHFTKIKIVSSNFERFISIHKIVTFNRNYLFESFDSTNFSIYAHLIDDKINFILIRNNSDKFLKIFRNFKLSFLFQFSDINVFQINTHLFDMILRNSKSDHKIFWFKKILVATAYTANIDSQTFKQEISLINEITIHEFFRQVVIVFINLLNKYFNIWTNQDFVKLSKKNWMKLSLKINWEDKIKEKTKVYSFEIRDKEVINNTFDELHKQEKLSYIIESTSFNFSCFVV